MNLPQIGTEPGQMSNSIIHIHSIVLEFAFLPYVIINLLKDKLPIVKLTFKSGVNKASQEFCPEHHFERCPLCGVKLDKDVKCPKCGYSR